MVSQNISIVSHYHPFSIDELLDSIDNSKIDISTWIDEDDKEARKKLINAGKVLIAMFLLQSERKEVFKNDAICWYRHLRNAIITSGKTKSEIEKKLESLTIISFNYDRSLDYFLRTRLSDFYEKISSRIIYPYGCLAQIKDWNKDKKDYSTIRYGYLETNSPNPKQRWEVFEEAKRIGENDHLKVIGELTKEDEEQIQAKVLADCHLYFLGFAFHEDNCRVLGIDHKAFRSRPNLIDSRHICYTNYGNSKKIEKSFDARFGKIGHSSDKGVYDALLKDFNFRLF
ncbi:MAG: hypothetical protein KGP29_06195 [Proteobacteria bacterium]|nr:hypothetical protein [Pseudomonadota bacterium]